MGSGPLSDNVVIDLTRVLAAMRRLGIDWEGLHRRTPKLIIGDLGADRARILADFRKIACGVY